jgi:hypothetical protein
VTSRTRRERKPPDPKAPSTAPPAPSVPSVPVRPFKPHPILFAVMMLLFAIWVSILLILYFKTVYPHRHPARPTTVSMDLTSVTAVAANLPTI